MALIDGKKFSEIVHKYGCEKKVFGYVRKRILRDYYLTDNVPGGTDPKNAKEKINRLTSTIQFR